MFKSSVDTKFKAYIKKRLSSLDDGVLEFDPQYRNISDTEVEQLVEILKDPSSHKKYHDTVELSLHLSENMLIAAKFSSDRASARAELMKHLNSGAAYEKFLQICKAQSGDLSALPKAKHKKEFFLKDSGYISKIETEGMGIAGILIGAGRKQLTDKLDLTAGFEMHYKHGDKYDAKTPVLTMYANGTDKFAETEAKLAQCFELSSQPVQKLELIKEDIYSF